MSIDNASLGDGQLLKLLLTRELQSLGVNKWGFFFPCYLAIWKFIEIRRPQALGSLNAGYDSEPYFKGKGATWFTEVLPENLIILDLIESVMYDAAKSVNSTIIERGFMLSHEVPQLNIGQIDRLVTSVLAEVDNALKNNLIV